MKIFIVGDMGGGVDTHIGGWKLTPESQLSLDTLGESEDPTQVVRAEHKAPLCAKPSHQPKNFFLKRYLSV